MCKENIYKRIVDTKNGVYVRATYDVDVTDKLKASNRKLGYSARKVTSTTGRVGCDYNNMKSVIERKATAEPSNRNYTNPYEWVVPNKIKRHKDKGTEYLVLGTVPKSNTKTKWIITHNDETYEVDRLTDEVGDLFVPSYVGKKDSHKPEVITIKLDNLIAFGGVQ